MLIKKISAIWGWLGEHHNSILVLVTVFALLMSFLSYRATIRATAKSLKLSEAALGLQKRISDDSLKLNQNALEIQQKEFRLRNRPILIFIPRIAEDKEQIIIDIKNVSDIPAVRVKVTFTIYMAGMLVGDEQHQVAAIAHDKISIIIDVKNNNFKDLLVLMRDELIVKIVSHYEGPSEYMPMWFESFLDFKYRYEKNVFTITRLDQKEHWDQKLPEWFFHIPTD